jgi:hypothetical protein
MKVNTIEDGWYAGNSLFGNTITGDTAGRSSYAYEHGARVCGLPSKDLFEQIDDTNCDKVAWQIWITANEPKWAKACTFDVDSQINEMGPDGTCAADSLYCCIPRYADRILSLNKDKMNQIVLLEIKKTKDQAKKLWKGRGLSSWTSLIKRAVHAYCQTQGDKDCSLDEQTVSPNDEGWLNSVSGATKVQMISHHGSLNQNTQDITWTEFTKGWPLQCQCKCPGGGVWPTSYIPNNDEMIICDRYYLEKSFKISKQTGVNNVNAYYLGGEGCQCLGGKMRDNFLEWEKVVTQAGTMKTIHCGEEHSNISEVIDIMQQTSGANGVEEIFNPEVTLGFEPTETDNKEVVGKFCYGFDYNPLAACRNEDRMVTGPECERWTTHTDGCWNFSVTGKYKGEPVSDATRYDDLTITMIPEYCKLIFKKPSISLKGRVCELQADFFKRITSKIWAEKVSTQIDQVGFNHRKDVLFVWDVEKDRPVVFNGEKVEETDQWCYTETANALVRGTDGELVLTAKAGGGCPTLSTAVVSHYVTNIYFLSSNQASKPNMRISQIWAQSLHRFTTTPIQVSRLISLTALERF